MPDNPDTLLLQLSRRVENVLKATGVSQRKLARWLKTDEAHIANFLAGRTGLSAEKSLKLMQILNTTRSQLEAKFGSPVTSRILHLQSSDSQAMTLDSNGGWVPGLAGAGSDPDGSTNIVSTNKNPARQPPDPDELEFLAGLAGLHQQIIDKINGRQAMKGKVNRDGATESGRKVNSNDKSSSPGSRGDMLSRLGINPKEHLKWLETERIKAEQELAVYKQIEHERKLTLAARLELAKLSKR